MQRMQAELDSKNFVAEQESFMKDYGIPPRITELAKPLLFGHGRTVELSNGTKVDPSKVMRDVLMAVGEQVRLLDMDNALGTFEVEDGQDTGADRRVELMKAIRRQTPGL